MYKNLEIWKESIALIKTVYSECELLPKSEEYNLKSQLKRAVVSVALNIAEGKNRNSAKDFAHFLNIAVASLCEVEAIISICEELEFLKHNTKLRNSITVLIKRTNALRTNLAK
ncbi:MAG: four helix bundle protein [Endomicrobium sp.]|jgi:four helix bundle protein|nr:four helix bundle protein [Endomicrobium sp.]